MPKRLETVTKSNALVEATYRLSLMEQRILLVCLSQIDPREPITDKARYRVTIEDLARLSGNTKNLHQIAGDALIRLYRREVCITHLPNGGVKPEEPEITGWIQGRSPNPPVQKGVMLLRLSTAILPYISDLRREFTRYNLNDIAKFKSAYSIRIYELACQYRNVGMREIGIDDLREMLQIGDKYKVTKDLKRYVLDAALKDINAKTPLQVSYESIKTGRAISGFRFLIAEKTTARPAPEKPAPAPAPRPRLTRAYIERHARPGESWDDAKARLSDALDR